MGSGGLNFKPVQRSSSDPILEDDFLVKVVYQARKNVLQFWLCYIRKMVQFHVLDLILWSVGRQI